MGEKVNGLVNAEKIYYPNGVITRMLKTWSLKCGGCKKDFVRFSITGKPICPHCGQKNYLNMTVYY